MHRAQTISGYSDIDLWRSKVIRSKPIVSAFDLSLFDIHKFGPHEADFELWETTSKILSVHPWVKMDIGLKFEENPSKDGQPERRNGSGPVCRHH